MRSPGQGSRTPAMSARRLWDAVIGVYAFLYFLLIRRAAGDEIRSEGVPTARYGVPELSCVPHKFT